MWILAVLLVAFVLLTGRDRSVKVVSLTFLSIGVVLPQVISWSEVGSWLMSF